MRADGEEREPDRDPEEERLRALFRASNPIYGVPVPPPRLSAAELRALAEAERPAAARMRRLVTPGLAAGGVALLLLAVVALPGRQHVPAGPPPSTPAPVALPATAEPARDALLDLVARVLACNESEVSGRYTYVRKQTWSRSTTPVPGGGDAATARDEQLWWATDGSGREIVTPLPPEPAGWTRASWTDELPPDVQPQRRDYPPGELAVAVPDPSADPAVLAGQLSAQQPFENGPQAPLRAVADMYGYHFLDRGRRAAALRVLADTEQLRYRGSVTDRAGRSGIAVTIESDAGATTDLAVFDPQNGALLSYERLTRLAGPQTPVREPVVMSYVLYLAHGRTDRLGAPDL